MNSTQLHNLAVMFRLDDFNLGHVSTFDAMTEAGLAYSFGVFMATPRRHRLKRRKLANDIAQALDNKANNLQSAQGDSQVTMPVNSR